MRTPIAQTIAVPPPAAAQRRAMSRAPLPLQRSQGTARIAFKLSNGGTALDELFQAGCCKLRLPTPEPGRCPEAILINTAGGLTDGDSIEMHAHWRRGTTAALTSQAAERIYRSRGQPARIVTALHVEADASALWLPQETILFDGSRCERRIDIDMAPGAELLACESVVFGRTAMREQVRTGWLRDAWNLRRDGRLVFADTLRLGGDMHALLARPAVAAGAHALATVLMVTKHVTQALAIMRAALGAAVCAGASAIGSLLVARLLGSTGAALKRDLIALLERLLPLLPGAGLPRSWQC